MLKSVVSEALNDALTTHSEPPEPKLKAKEQQQRAQPIPFRTRALKFCISILVGLATLIGGAWVLYDLRPKISIAEDRSIANGDPLESRFTLTNDSFFAIRSVSVGCHAYSLVTSHNIRIFGGILFTDNPNTFEDIAAGQPVTFHCYLNGFAHPATGGTLGQDTTHADIGVSVKFSYISWIPWSKPIEKTFRFVTEGSLGHLHWYPQPAKD